MATGTSAGRGTRRGKLEGEKSSRLLPRQLPSLELPVLKVQNQSSNEIQLSGDSKMQDVSLQIPIITLTSPDQDVLIHEKSSSMKLHVSDANRGMHMEDTNSIHRQKSSKDKGYSNRNMSISSKTKKSFVEASDSFKLVHDVITLAKKWKKRTQENQARKELDVQAEQEQRKALAALHLPKRIICDITEETLSIVIATEHTYRHHLGAKHPLTIKAMEKANSLCVELRKDPIYTL